MLHVVGFVQGSAVHITEQGCVTLVHARIEGSSVRLRRLHRYRFYRNTSWSPLQLVMETLLYSFLNCICASYSRMLKPRVLLVSPELNAQRPIYDDTSLFVKMSDTMQRILIREIKSCAPPERRSAPYKMSISEPLMVPLSSCIRDLHPLLCMLVIRG